MPNSFEPMFQRPDQAGAPWLMALQSRGDFAADPRFAGTGEALANNQGDPALQTAIDEAFAAGEKHGREAAAADHAARDQAHDTLRLSVGKLDQELQQKLSTRLAETVAALCEETLAPLALDRDALERRCVAAAHLLGEAVVDATLRLHPDDIHLLGPDFAATWHMLSDPQIERGTISFETPEGAVIDGPAEWRAALHEALGL